MSFISLGLLSGTEAQTLVRQVTSLHSPIIFSPFSLEFPKHIHSHRKIPIYRHGQICRLSAGLGLCRKFGFPWAVAVTSSPSANINDCHEVTRIDLLISG